MSCEQEQAEVTRLSGEAQDLKRECDELAAGLGEDDPQVMNCRASQFSTEAQLAAAQLALTKCRDGQQAARLLRAEGFLTFLRVHDLGTNFGGGQSNKLQAEVIFKLDSRPGKAFGFQLREDKFQPARQGMLALLRDALVHDLNVATDYLEEVDSSESEQLRDTG